MEEWTALSSLPFPNSAIVRPSNIETIYGTRGFECVCLLVTAMVAKCKPPRSCRWALLMASRRVTLRDGTDYGWWDISCIAPAIASEARAVGSPGTRQVTERGRGDERGEHQVSQRAWLSRHVVSGLSHACSHSSAAVPTFILAMISVSALAGT
jgi:hypothetical protein